MTDTERTFDDVAARALASIVLERTADTLSASPDKAREALEQFESDTGLALDVCAGVLLATSWLAGVGQIDPQAVFAGALAMEPGNDESLTDAG